jgi:DHA1 family bicyclomycin/chloramphenicol resistance-like MFS transporter
MVLFIIGSAGCALSTASIRLFSGAFSGSGGLYRADAGAGDGTRSLCRTRAAQMLSTLTIVMAIAPIIGPLMGGQMIKSPAGMPFSGCWRALVW